MICEVCGKEIEGKPLRVKIEQAVMETCPECAKRGTIQRAPPQKTVKKSQKLVKKTSNRPRQRKRDVYTREEEITEEIVEDFDEICRQGREFKGWSREKLGAEIQEKVSVIKKIESGKMVPDIKLARKTESKLNIRIIEDIDEIDLDQFKSSSSDGFTLGDIVKIKK